MPEMENECGVNRGYVQNTSMSAHFLNQTLQYTQVKTRRVYILMKPAEMRCVRVEVWNVCECVFAWCPA